MQLPVVATRVAGIPDVVEHERNGLVVESEDRTALSKAIVSLAMDPDRRARMAGNNLTDAATLYEWSANFKRYKAALRQLALGEPPTNPGF